MVGDPWTLDIGVIGVTDAKGVVVFTNVPPRETRVQVSAGGSLPSAISRSTNSDAPMEGALAPAPR